MAFYTDESGRVVSDDTRYSETKKIRSSTTLSIAKVFGYMFAGLLITGLVAFGLAFIFFNWMQSDRDRDTASNVLFFTMIGTAIGIIVMSIVVTFQMRKQKMSAILIPAIIYAVLMGVMLSTFVLFLDWRLLGGAFLATSLIFGLMALIALLSKGNLNGLAIVGIGLFFGAGIMSLFTWFLSLIYPPGTFPTFYWIITLGMFAGMMFITMWDIWRIKKLAEAGMLTNNVSLYCAFNLYVDFIYIFIRMLYIFSALSGRNN